MVSAYIEICSATDDLWDGTGHKLAEYMMPHPIAGGDALSVQDYSISEETLIPGGLSSSKWEGAAVVWCRAS